MLNKIRCHAIGVALGLGLLAAAGPQALAQTDVDLLLADGHYLRAERLLKAALQQNPNDARALSNQSVVDWAFGRLDISLANAEKAVAAAPNDVGANSHLTDALGSKLLSSNAGTFEKISLARRFRKQIDRTLALDPNDLDTLQDLAEFLWHAPGMVGGDKTKAQQTADKLYAISPFRGASARVDFLSDDSDAARRNAATLAIWQTTVAARPDNFDARTSLAAAYLAAGDAGQLAKAETEAKRAVALDRTRVDGYKVLAGVYARAGHWDELEAVLKQARGNVSDDRSPEYVAAATILNANAGSQMQRAEQMLRDYLGQPAEGQEANHASAHWRLGQVLEQQGRKDDAVRELRMAVEQDGTLDGAKKDLKRLS